LERDGQRQGDGDASREAIVFLPPSLAGGYRSLCVVSSNVIPDPSFLFSLES
jgi:hypothetical protein